MNRVRFLTFVNIFTVILTAHLSQGKLRGEVLNPGSPVNSPEDELYPTISGDGNEIYFNSKRGGLSYHDIFVTRKGADGSWSKPEPLKEINSEFNDETPFVSEDGSVLLFSSDRDGSLEMSRDRYNRVKVSYDIYISLRNKDGTWGKPVRIPGDVNTVNHERFPSLSPDGTTLYYSTWPFADIEKIRVMKARFDSGRFLDVEEMPRVINTGKMEVQLVYSRTRKGFFFSSTRHGTGGWDLFFLPFADGKFGKVKNLGEPFNSEENETGMASTSDLIVVSSNRKGGLGGYDLYFINDIKDESGLFRFKIIDEKSKNPLEARARIVVRKADIAKEGTSAWEIEKASKADGRFDLKAHRKVSKFQVIVNREGYLPFVEEFDATIPPEKIVELPLTPVEKEARLTIRAIHFASNDSRIQSESIPYLKSLAEFLRKNPRVKLEIIGHTDLHGSESYNRSLSLARATSVRDFLVKEEISIDRFKIHGAGKSKPAANGIGSPFDEQNRRTEFRVIEK